jgi:hypothetical protein
LLIKITFAQITIKLMRFKSQQCLAMTYRFMANLPYKTRLLTQLLLVAIYTTSHSSIANIKYNGVITTGFSNRKSGQI